MNDKKKKRNQEDSLPQSNGKDLAHFLVRTGLSAVPVVGGPVLEIFNELFTPSLEKRRNKWFQQLYDSLVAVEDRVGHLEELVKEEDFITVAIHASQIAIRTHQQEKLDALRNGVLNTAKKINIKEDAQLIFLNLIDYFTPSHLAVLNALETHTPVHFSSQIKEKDDSVSSVLHIYPDISKYEQIAVDIVGRLPQFNGDTNFISQITRDLYSRNLLEDDDKFIAKKDEVPFSLGSHIPSVELTQLGKDFLRYISSTK